MKKDQDQTPKKFTCKACKKSYKSQSSMYNHIRIKHKNQKNLILNNNPKRIGRPKKNQECEDHHTILQNHINSINNEVPETELLSTASTYKTCIEQKPITLQDFQHFVSTDGFKHLFEQATKIPIGDDHTNHESMQNNAMSEQEQLKKQQQFHQLEEICEKDGLNQYSIDKIASIFKNISSVLSPISNSIIKDIKMYNQQNYQEISMNESYGQEEISNLKTFDNPNEDNYSHQTEKSPQDQYYYVNILDDDSDLVINPNHSNYDINNNNNNNNNNSNNNHNNNYDEEEVENLRFFHNNFSGYASN